jgi:cytoskeletal protein CcmA (bactofilin family)
MSKQFPSIMKIAVAAAIGLLAVVIPSLPVKILLAIAGIVILATSLKKFSWLLIVLSVIFLVLPVTVFSIISGIDGNILRWPLGIISNPGIQRWFDWIGRMDYDGFNQKTTPQTYYMPDKYIDSGMEIDLKGIGYQVSFDEDSDQIHLSSELDVRNVGSRIYISMPDHMKNATAILTIGTKNGLSKAVFDVVALSLEGKLTAREVSINAVSVSIKGDVEAENRILVGGVSISIPGNLIAPRVTIEGAPSLSITGRIEAEEFHANNCIAVSLAMESVGVKELSIGASTVNGRIKYLDSWPEKRSVRISGLSGSITLTMPKGSGGFELFTSGRISVTTSEY